MPGAILWEGASQIDHQPIVVIATWNSRNRKTGDMLQTWILRADISPLQAIADGQDVSICGTCKHRKQPDTGKRSCYVNVGQAPNGCWKAYKRGSYDRADSIASIGMGRRVRLGAYGDPAAVPAHIWRKLISLSLGHTGYTHQWKMAFAGAFRDLCMASVDNEEERDLAHANGWRTFRVTPEVEDKGSLISAGEVACPASAEQGARTQCASCMLCAGTSKLAKSIAIAEH